MSSQDQTKYIFDSIDNTRMIENTLLTINDSGMPSFGPYE